MRLFQAMPQDLAKLSALFPREGVSLVMGSDVVLHASAYRHHAPGGAWEYDHIVFARAEGEERTAVDQAIRSRIQGKLRLLSLPPYYETVSSTRIRESIDKNMDISAGDRRKRGRRCLGRRPPGQVPGNAMDPIPLGPG